MSSSLASAPDLCNLRACCGAREHRCTWPWLHGMCPDPHPLHSHTHQVVSGLSQETGQHFACGQHQSHLGHCPRTLGTCAMKWILMFLLPLCFIFFFKNWNPGYLKYTNKNIVGWPLNQCIFLTPSPGQDMEHCKHLWRTLCLSHSVLSSWRAALYTFVLPSKETQNQNKSQQQKIQKETPHYSMYSFMSGRICSLCLRGTFVY
jgi:hypothetical protein